VQKHTYKLKNPSAQLPAPPRLGGNAILPRKNRAKTHIIVYRPPARNSALSGHAHPVRLVRFLSLSFLYREVLMISEKKLEANRRNAQKSTGPKSEEGKAISRMNGLKHGLTSEFVPILPGEDEEAFNELHHEIVNDLKPRGAMQREVVDDIAQIRWKLRRLSRVEAQMMARSQQSIRKRYALELECHQRFHKGKPFEEPLEDHPIQILSKHGCADSEFGRLELYRQRLHRQMHTLLRELRQLRKEMVDQNDDDSVPGHSERTREESRDPGSVPPARDPSRSTARDDGARGKPEPTDSHNPMPGRWKENDSLPEEGMMPVLGTEKPDSPKPIAGRGHQWT
jgi:hypothetical protein